MQGCQTGKNSAFSNSLFRNQTYTMNFDGPNTLHEARFFPPKDLLYFWLKTRHHSKAQTLFFPTTIFPLNDLVFFYFFMVPFKSATISNSRQKTLIFLSSSLVFLKARLFPAKRLPCNWLLYDSI